MIANTENIQLIYNDYPNTFLVNGVRIDNYKKSEDHFLHGWREVVIPEITKYQKLGDYYFLDGDIVTKEVIDWTYEEIQTSRINQAIAIDLEYTKKISDLLAKPIERLNCDGIPISQSKLDERDALRAECNAKISELGITDFTYRQSVPKLSK